MGGEKKLAAGSVISVGFFLILFMGGCAEVRLNTIPAPPPSAKLRVLVLPLTGSAPPGGWKTPDEEFMSKQLGVIGNILRETGIYAMPTKEEFDTVVGKQKFTNWEWQEKGQALAKRVGQALFSDYVMIIERAFNARVRFHDVWLTNLESGKQFRVSFRAPLGGRYNEEWVQIGRVALREIFRDAKGDMLATAMRKRSLSAEGRTSHPAGEGKKEEPGGPALPVRSRQVDLEEALKERPASAARALVAVYDFNSSEPLRVAALILSEALREELFRLGSFTLVNRENMVQVLNEMGVQQTGLVNEKQAVQAGKGLAARQIILGQFGALGKILLLQVKRIDVETQATLSLSSIKCALGKEDDMLATLPQLAKELARK